MLDVGVGASVKFELLAAPGARSLSVRSGGFACVGYRHFELGAVCSPLLVAAVAFADWPLFE
jgi:hypothetical protein